MRDEVMEGDGEKEGGTEGRGKEDGRQAEREMSRRQEEKPALPLGF